MEPAVDRGPWLDRRTLPPVVGVLGLLAFLDLVLGHSLFNVTTPALVADVGLIAAVLAAGRWPLESLGFGAAMSAGVSLRVALARHGATGPLVYSPVMGTGGAWPGFAELAGLALLTALCIRSLTPARGIAAGATFAGALAAIAQLRQNGPVSTPVVLALGVVLAVAVAAGTYLRSVDRTHALESRQVRQDERTAIARELHDLVAHHMTGIVLQAQAATLVADTRPELAYEALETIERAGTEALRSMRAMVGSLRADDGAAPLAPTATIEDLRTVGLRQPGEVPVRVQLGGPVDQLPATIVASLHRIAIEGVTNARRHAVGATAIDVTVAARPEDASITITDDGEPPHPRLGLGYGLVGIAERVAAVGGTTSAGPGPLRGWVVQATLPIRSA